MRRTAGPPESSQRNRDISRTRGVRFDRGHLKLRLRVSFSPFVPARLDSGQRQMSVRRRCSNSEWSTFDSGRCTPLQELPRRGGKSGCWRDGKGAVGFLRHRGGFGVAAQQGRRVAAELSIRLFERHFPSGLTPWVSESRTAFPGGMPTIRELGALLYATPLLRTYPQFGLLSAADSFG